MNTKSIIDKVERNINSIEHYADLVLIPVIIIGTVILRYVINWIVK